MNYWKSVDPVEGVAHYKILECGAHDGNAIDALRNFFDHPDPFRYCFILFNTGGVHGGYGDFNEMEKKINLGVDESELDSMSYLIVEFRRVNLRYGNVKPKTIDDINFLRELNHKSQISMQEQFLDD